MTLSVGNHADAAGMGGFAAKRRSVDAPDLCVVRRHLSLQTGSRGRMAAGPKILGIKLATWLCCKAKVGGMQFDTERLCAAIEHCNCIVTALEWLEKHV